MCTAFRSAAAPSSEAVPCSGRKACAHALLALHFSKTRAMRHGPCNPSPVGTAAGALTTPTSTPVHPISLPTNTHNSCPAHAHTASCWGAHHLHVTPWGSRAVRHSLCMADWPPASGAVTPHAAHRQRCTLSATRLMRRALGTSSSSKGACTKKATGMGVPKQGLPTPHATTYEIVRRTVNPLVRHERDGVAAAVSTAGSDLERACAFPPSVWPCQAQSAGDPSA